MNPPPDPDHVIRTKRVVEDVAPPVLRLKKEILAVETNLEIADHEADLETDGHAADPNLARDKVKDRDQERDLRENTRRSDIRTSTIIILFMTKL